MTHSWTGEQWEAITARGGNMLVSAAAGAGKTAVLVERVISLLTDTDRQVDIDRLLVVTFTEAAAAEMRERIALALESMLADRHDARLSKQLSLLHGAPISTLHSFCLDVIRRHFYKLDIDPSFRIADGQEAVMLQQDVLEQLLEEKFSSTDNENFLALVGRYGGSRGDNKLSGLLLGLYRFMQSNPWPHHWLDGAVSAFSTTSDDGADSLPALWLEPVRKKLRQKLEFTADLLEQANRLTAEPGAPAVYRDTLLAEKEQIDSLLPLLGASWDKLRSGWLQAEFKPLPAAKNVDETLKKKIAGMRNQAKDVVRDATEIYFTRGSSEYLAEICELAPLVSTLAELVLDFSRLYGQRKRVLGLLDFNDLEHFCLEILNNGETPGQLAPSASARQMRKDIEYVLVDEYQDINPVQDAILNLVSRQGEEEPNLFMVGDVKQSIYRFRLADPGLFLGRYHLYRDEQDAAERRLSLSCNFRCRSSVVNAVNYLFRQLMTSEAAEMAYDRSAELVYGAGYPDSGDQGAGQWPVEVHLVGKNEKGKPQAGKDVPGDEAEDASRLEREGSIIADRIRKITGNGGDAEGCLIFDNGRRVYRPLEFRDIVILLRATAGRANGLVEILRRYGIPAYAELSTGYFSAVEVETMISLLTIVDNPRQDIALAAVLRSVLVGLGSEEMASVRAFHKHGDFYDAVVYAAENESELSPKLREFLMRLDRWRDMARRESLTAFIGAVYNESGLADYVCGLPDGAQRQVNLHSLFERARQFDRFSRQGISRFLRFINQLRSSGEDLGTPRILGEKENVVRILSIHKAKGLEFPVVIICDLAKRFNFTDTRQEILFHRKLGISPLVVDADKRIHYPSLPYLALRLQAEEETRAEEMRIFYVALTRARERLILVGSVDDVDNESEKWQFYLDWAYRQLPPAQLAGATACLDWLRMSLARHTDLFGSPGQYVWQDGENSRFSLKLWGGKYSCQLPTHDEPAQNGVAEEETDTVLTAETREGIRQRLSFRYNQESAALPAKLTVTEAKNRYFPPEEGDAQKYFRHQDWPLPSFIQKSRVISASLRGTFYHLVMQHLDLWQTLDEAGVSGQITRLIKEKRLTSEEAEQLEAEKIATFFTSSAGSLLLSHRERAVRELPFIMSVASSRLFDQQSLAKDSIVVQGVIDLLVDTGQGSMIVDYKTGRVPQETTAMQHGFQLALYAEAAEKILGVPVVACYIYYLDAAILVAIDYKKYNLKQKHCFGLQDLLD